MHLLVTGSSGQIGSYLVEAARAAGHEVKGIDLRPSAWTSEVADVRRPEDLRRALADADGVVHLAAHVSVPESVEKPLADADHNVLGTVNVLEEARRADIGRVVFVSSAAVYGVPETTPLREDHPTRPISPYGVSKLAGEHYSRVAYALHGLSVVTVRPFNVYSPRQDPRNPYSGVMSLFADRIRSRQPPTIFGDGSQTRDFVRAQDVAKWLLRLGDPKTKAGPDPINLGTGIATPIKDLAQMFMDHGRMRGKPRFEKSRPGDIQDSVADVSRLRGLKLAPAAPVRESVASMLAS